MKPGDSQQQFFPPMRSRVKAGFVVYSPDSEDRNIIMLEQGQLSAIDESSGGKKTVFTMNPGDLIGVAALLENEPFKYKLEAVCDSDITLISKECMESVLKTLPVWLLAVIRNLSARTHQLKEGLHGAHAENTLKSLAEYCSAFTANKLYSLALVTQEFHWLTRIPPHVIENDLKTLIRRHFIEFQKDDENVSLKTENPMLLKIFVDFLDANKSRTPFIPFTLDENQRKILVAISKFKPDQALDAPSWIHHFAEAGVTVSVSEWIRIKNYGWFQEKQKDLYQIDEGKVLYDSTAIRFESNFKGAI